MLLPVHLPINPPLKVLTVLVCPAWTIWGGPQHRCRLSSFAAGQGTRLHRACGIGQLRTRQDFHVDRYEHVSLLQFVKRTCAAAASQPAVLCSQELHVQALVSLARPSAAFSAVSSSTCSDSAQASPVFSLRWCVSVGAVARDRLAIGTEKDVLPICGQGRMSLLPMQPSRVLKPEPGPTSDRHAKSSAPKRTTKKLYLPGANTCCSDAATIRLLFRHPTAW